MKPKPARIAPAAALAAAVGFCAQALFEELRVRGYGGSYDVVKPIMSPLRTKASIEAIVRFETPPGR